MTVRVTPKISLLILLSVLAAVAVLKANDKVELIPLPKAKPAAAPTAAVIEGLLKASVTVKASGSTGSGFVISRDNTSWVLTAGHVVASLRRERVVPDPKSGQRKALVEFGDVGVYQIAIEGGRIVGRSSYDAEVVRYSDANYGEDLALLRVRKKNAFTESVRFADDMPPSVGSELYHVGSLLGDIGASSFTRGIMSQHGRVLNLPSKVVFDQAAVTTFPGSSGGLVATSDGLVTGMVVRGAGEGFTLLVPVRRIREWAGRVGVGFLFDPKAKAPSDKELAVGGIEEVGR